MLAAVLLKRPKGDTSSFFRAGIKFEAGEHVYSVTPEQLKAIKAEPMLRVSEVHKSSVMEHIAVMRTAEDVDAIAEGYRDRDILMAAETRKAELEAEAQEKSSPAEGITRTREISPQEKAYPLIDACTTEEAVKAVTEGDDRKGIKERAEARMEAIRAEGGSEG